LRLFCLKAKLGLHLIRLLLQKSSSKVAVGPIMLGFFLFVVVGSGTTALYCLLLACLVYFLLICRLLKVVNNAAAALLQIIRTATSGASLL